MRDRSATWATALPGSTPEELKPRHQTHPPAWRRPRDGSCCEPTLQTRQRGRTLRQHHQADGETTVVPGPAQCPRHRPGPGRDLPAARAAARGGAGACLRLQPWRQPHQPPDPLRQAGHLRERLRKGGPLRLAGPAPRPRQPGGGGAGHPGALPRFPDRPAQPQPAVQRPDGRRWGGAGGRRPAGTGGVADTGAVGRPSPGHRRRALAHPGRLCQRRPRRGRPG